MNLRRKFGLLLLIFTLSLAVNFVMSAWSIVVYFESAFRVFQSGASYEQQVDQLRQVLRRQRALLEENRDPQGMSVESAALSEQWSELLNGILEELPASEPGSLGRELVRLSEQKEKLIHQLVASRKTQPDHFSLSDSESRTLGEMDLHLLNINNWFGQIRQKNVAQAAQTQEHVMTILVVNTMLGMGLAALGIFFVRRWIMYPIQDLREATKQIGQGNFAYRIQPRSGDELGQLGNEINQMTAMIVQMQQQLVENERLAAAGEMVTRLAHNIRNPLAGIRGLAEATVAIHPNDETAGCQHRIIDTIDRFEKWLRDLQQSVSPLELKMQEVSVEQLLKSVATALRPMFEKRGVMVNVDVPSRMPVVRLDSMHFEQAVVSLVTNAVQASEPGQTVRVAAEPLDDLTGRWKLIVEDHGVGIPREIQHKIFQPYFTTKPDGNGIGLATARKVVRLHGGELTVESEPGHGSRFEATMPGLGLEGDSDG